MSITKNNSISTEIISDLINAINSHKGRNELNLFGKSLAKHSLNNHDLKILFATLWAFYKETPSGILSLSLRLNDYWQTIDPWDAMANAAFLLCTAVDEFGLANTNKIFMLTHHQLFLQTIKYFSITKNDLESSLHTLSAGYKIGKYSYEFYREKALPLSLGFHFASEFTSLPEFICLFEGFMANAQNYNIYSETDEAMKFFRIHTYIEPDHSENSKNILNIWLNQHPNDIKLITEGAMLYMECYKDLFYEINKKIFTKNNKIS